MATFEERLTRDYSLTTAEILYHMPDFPKVLQSYIWQDFDMAPQYPILGRFLDFWTRELDGKIHSVYVASRKVLTPGDISYRQAEFTVQ